MASWIQGGRGSFWWRQPSWIEDGWSLVLDEFGDLILRTKRRIPAKRTLVEAGFVGVRVAKDKGYVVLPGETAWLVTLEGLVPAPKYSEGETSYHPGSGEVVIDFAVRMTEVEARAFWTQGEMTKHELLFFGGLGAAKRAARRAFKLRETRPDRHPALTTGSIWIDRKGRVVP